MRGRDIAIILLVAFLALLVLGLLFGGMMGPGMMGWGGYGFYPLMWVAMLLFWGLLIGGAVALVVWLVRQSAPPATPAGVPQTRALDILKERYARGELTREEYEQMRREIEG